MVGGIRRSCLAKSPGGQKGFKKDPLVMRTEATVLIRTGRAGAWDLTETVSFWAGNPLKSHHALDLSFLVSWSLTAAESRLRGN